MPYDRKVTEAAQAELERRRQSAESTADANLQRFYSLCPRAVQVRQEMAHNAAAAARAVLSGGNVREAMEQRKQRGLALNREFEELLQSQGMTLDQITPQYVCGTCRDTGFSDGKMCECYRRLRRQTAYRQLSRNLPLAASTFDNFSLDHYRDDPRALKRMSVILRTCREYAQRLRPNSSSLLFYGGTGLGKTHLSLAIANAAIEKDMGVVYGSVQGFTSAFEKERFDREDETATAESLKDCDLLILDDLGAEASSVYVNAALYDVINSRLMGNRPTIISSNLTIKGLEKRYGDRLASRIAGYFGKLEFLGRDMRAEKQLQRHGGS